ncbi:Charged multivesicular body protein 4b [Portunus trituberculatus]|uniref:Charged multivesicular body protein 4b n=1 Tax=Portunus trituberculatus TaxID=210409 RepID=A0A5B7DFF2_PORTR|nr:Charged multivesicular body protein 4b [Portunus trituberculatus]
MSIFGKIFGGGKNEKAPTTGEAIQKLRDTEEMLVKKQDFLEKKIQSEISIAKQNGTKNKRVALQALKRKKRYDKQLQQIDGTLSTIEMQREALESANTNTNVLETMSNAAKALKAAHKHITSEYTFCHHNTGTVCLLPAVRSSSPRLWVLSVESGKQASQAGRHLPTGAVFLPPRTFLEEQVVAGILFALAFTHLL